MTSLSSLPLHGGAASFDPGVPAGDARPIGSPEPGALCDPRCLSPDPSGDPMGRPRPGPSRPWAENAGGHHPSRRRGCSPFPPPSMKGAPRVNVGRGVGLSPRPLRSLRLTVQDSDGTGFTWKGGTNVAMPTPDTGRLIEALIDLGIIVERVCNADGQLSTDERQLLNHLRVLKLGIEALDLNELKAISQLRTGKVNDGLLRRERELRQRIREIEQQANDETAASPSKTTAA